MDLDVLELAAAVEELGEVGQNTLGQLSALLCAVTALVRSHPDPEAFAAEFRRSWLLAKARQVIAADDTAGQEGLDEVLRVLEDASTVRLAVRAAR